MSYNQPMGIDLGKNYAGATPTVDLVLADNTEIATDVGTVTAIGDGKFALDYDWPDNFSGLALIMNGSTIESIETIIAPDRTVEQLLLARSGGQRALWVAASGGSDANSGFDWHSPKATINSAWAAASSGDIVMVLPGIHELSGGGKQTIPAGVTMRGYGRGLSTIKMSGVVEYLEAKDGVVLEDLTIDGSASIVATIKQDSNATAARVTMRRVKVLAGAYGIWIDAPQLNKFLIEECHVEAAISAFSISSQSSSVIHQMIVRDSYGLADEALWPSSGDINSYTALSVYGRMWFFDSVLEARNATAAATTGCALAGDPVGIGVRGGGHIHLIGCEMHSEHTAGGVAWDMEALNAGSQIRFENCTSNFWSKDQANSGRIFSRADLMIDKISLALQKGQTVWYVRPAGAFASADPVSQGTYVADAFDSIQDAIDVATFGDSVYVLAGDYEITAAIAMKAGVALHGEGIARTRITMTGAGGGADSGIIELAAGVNWIEDMTLIDDSSSDGVSGIVGSGSSVISSVFDHLKIEARYDAVRFTATAASASNIENSTLKAGQVGIRSEGAAHLINHVGDHPSILADASLGPGGADTVAVRAADASVVNVRGPLRAVHTDGSYHARAVQAVGAARIEVIDASLTSSHSTAANAHDVSVDGAGSEVYLPASTAWDESKLTLTNSGRIKTDLASDLMAADQSIDDATSPFKHVRTSRWHGGVLSTKALTKLDENEVAAETDVVGGATET